MKLCDLGEDGFLAELRGRVPVPGPAVTLGIGDDAAALLPPPDELTLVSTDALVEGAHFTRETLPPRFVGRKAVAVNASDVAAMGGRPYALLCSLFASPREEVDYLLELFDGLIGRGRELGCDLVGGNLAASEGPLIVDVTILGASSGKKVLRRSGARFADSVFVSGKLGASAEGRALLGRGIAVAASGAVRLPSSLREGPVPLAEECLAAHRDPEPRIELGLFLAGTSGVTACMDISDGLARDLTRLAGASGVGVRIEESALPIHPGVLAWERVLGRDPLELALSGGEDYELLFTALDDAPLEDWRQTHDLALTRIGRVGDVDDGVTLVHRDGREQKLDPAGWDHFTRAARSGAMGPGAPPPGRLG